MEEISLHSFSLVLELVMRRIDLKTWLFLRRIIYLINLSESILIIVFEVKVIIEKVIATVFDWIRLKSLLDRVWLIVCTFWYFVKRRIFDGADED
jgi:hypothetical protein